MANTTSAKKATRKIARRTIVNKSRRTQMRGAVRTVEEAIKSGDRNAALEAMSMGRPVILSNIGGAREMINDGIEGYVVSPTELAARLPASGLTPPDPYLQECSFRLVSRHTTNWGLLHSDCWEHTS